MKPSRAPESLLLASPKIQDTLLKVRHAVKEFLQKNLDFTRKEAEDEEWNLLLPAFQHAINVAMIASPTVPVQPDWLIALTAHQLWFMACVCCRYDLDYPAVPVHIPTPEMYNDTVKPSPEHRARILQVAAAQRQIPGSGLNWALSLIQGVQVGFGAGRGGPPNRSQPVASRAAEIEQEVHSASQEDLEYLSPECSLAGSVSDISEVPSLEAPTTQEAVRAAESKRIETITRVRKVISGFVEGDIDSDPTLNYRFDVPDADSEVMALLWHSTGVAKRYRYPENESFSYSGRPWEVMIHRSSAALFFGPDFCHKAAILNRIRKFCGPAEIYAHFEGDFLHIGLTIPKDVVSTDLIEETQFPLTLFSTITKFNTLARWARNTDFGTRQSFVDWIDFTVRQDLINDNMGVHGARE
ncbi:hypothetical protein DHEL01_v211042 [Diaporthe helianthi]|uniref:Uncharacterized protein n=1 Tax=Diaporthe helianthi TaxID=158607 RepID=A0A2P5HJX6_DIAHE|nr:hypothetical protein DHEL01_v211042 [Diaporthe helianthi]